MHNVYTELARVMNNVMNIRYSWSFYLLKLLLFSLWEAHTIKTLFHSRRNAYEEQIGWKEGNG